jgi:signal transduction histidine kinase
MFDARLLDQLIWNLLDNAVKFSAEGGTVTIAIREDEGRLVLEIADAGPGIPEDAIGRIFDRFARADDAHGAEGTGLGLSIVRAVAEAHGGTVTAENRTSGGALFRVRLPLRPSMPSSGLAETPRA